MQVKPIAGRCGSNIDLVSHHEEVLDKTSGIMCRAEKHLSATVRGVWPKVTGNTFRYVPSTVSGNYGGMCLRGDESLGHRERAILNR